MYTKALYKGLTDQQTGGPFRMLSLQFRTVWAPFSHRRRRRDSRRVIQVTLGMMGWDGRK